MAFPTGWNRKCPIVLDADSVSGTGNLSSFPVLITEASLPSEMFDLAGRYPAKATGADVLFSSDSAGATPLACDLIAFDAANNTASFFVKVPTLAGATDTTIYCWYNNPTATPAARDSTYGGQAVWSDYAVVHTTFGDAPTMDRTAGQVHLPYGLMHRSGNTFITAISNSEYNAWPSLIKLASGTLLLSFRAGATVHALNNSGYIKVYKSLDAGRSWSSLSTIGSADSTRDYRNGELYQDDDASGTIYAVIPKADANGSTGSNFSIVYFRSTDDGATWDNGTSLTSVNGGCRGKPLRLANGLIGCPWYEVNSSNQARPRLTTIDPSDQTRTDYTVNATFNTYSEWSLTEYSGTVRGYFRGATDGVFTATASSSDLSTWSAFSTLTTSSATAPIEAQHISTGEVILAYSYERDPSAPVVLLRRSTDHGASLAVTDLAYILSGPESDPISGGLGYYPTWCELEPGLFAYAIYCDTNYAVAPTKILTGHLRLDASGRLTGRANYGITPDLASDTNGMVLEGSAYEVCPRSVSATVNYPHQYATYTIGALAKLDNHAASAIQCPASTQSTNAAGNNGFLFGFENRTGTKVLRLARYLNGTLIDHYSVSNAVTDNDYHLWHCSLAAGTPAFYVDGVAKGGTGTGTGVTTGAANFPYVLGRYANATPGGYLDGNLGIVYVRKDAISAEWSLTESNNWSAPGTFATAGTSIDTVLYGYWGVNA